MGKRGKRKRGAKRAHRGTPLGGHTRIGQTLVTPLNRIPNVAPMQWTFDRMPELLWAALVRAVLPRSDALAVFRKVVVEMRKALEARDLNPREAMPTLTHLATLYPDFIPKLVEIVAVHPLGYAALRPLLLFDALPGKDVWTKAIAADNQEGDAEVLMDAVVEYLWHQSEPATDIRWVCVAAASIVSQKMHYRKGADDEHVEGLRLYPDYGDMRAIRPFIRSSEMAMWMMQEGGYPWSKAFWEECHGHTPCMGAEPVDLPPVAPTAEEVIPNIAAAAGLISRHWFNTATTTGVDARHETVFALVLYALRCLTELLDRNRRRVAGRLLLRTIVEARITQAYLIHKDNSDLWKTYRRYGSGQAKLALLKISEAARQPHSVSIELLELLANEDVWAEFVDINLGNWAGLDLRKMAEASGTKDIYDTHYGWNSGYAHGQWAAVRDTTLTTCMNPLHRLHRIPLGSIREFGDVLLDAREVVEEMIGDLLQVYPGITVSLKAAPSAGAESPRPESKGQADDMPVD